MTAFALLLTPEAVQDIDQAVIYYDSVSKGLGAEFIKVIDKYFTQIQSVPTASAIQYDYVRVKPVSVFPYTIHYAILEGQIIVLRVFNTNQNPSFK